VLHAVTGERYDGCPWWSFQEPGVSEVLTAANTCRTAEGIVPALLLPSDPSEAVLAGVTHYARCVRLVRDDEAARAAEKAKKARRRG